MQILHIIIEPQSQKVVVQYKDIVGRRNQLFYDGTGNAAVQQILADAQQRLPADSENPDKSDIEQEISELEYRLRQLKLSIGVPA